MALTIRNSWLTFPFSRYSTLADPSPLMPAAFVPAGSANCVPVPSVLLVYTWSGDPVVNTGGPWRDPGKIVKFWMDRVRSGRGQGFSG